ncbi:MAG: hypothetical protein L3J30_10395 [Marinosulfonomonas sp.]|nr:hypothetical protein [Marinosulfonomonas sp.]
MMSITSPQAYGAGLRASEVTRLHVPHLAPHILTLPKGDRVNIIVGYSVSVRCARPDGADFDALVSTIDSGHLGALYVGKAEEATVVG